MSHRTSHSIRATPKAWLRTHPRNVHVSSDAWIKLGTSGGRSLQSVLVGPIRQSDVPQHRGVLCAFLCVIVPI